MNRGKRSTSLTDSDLEQTARKAEAFFETHIEALARKEDCANRWFSVAPGGQDDSYWDEPSASAAFKVYSLELESLSSCLAELWAEEPDLRLLADPLQSLANDIKRVELHDEISPFIYAMF